MAANKFKENRKIECPFLPTLFRHGQKRHVMVPGGPFMAKNDTSWVILLKISRPWFFALALAGDRLFEPKFTRSTIYVISPFSTETPL